MMSTPVWIDRGKPVTQITPAEMPDDPDVTFRLFGLVRCRTKWLHNRQCTLVEWDADNCHPQCLDYICNAIDCGDLHGPFVLKVFRIGWFTEFHETAASASARVDQLRAMQKVTSLPGMFFLSIQRDPDRAREQIRQIETGRVEERLVLSRVEPNGSVPLVKVGNRSMLAQVAGDDWTNSNPSAMEERFQNFDDSLVWALQDVNEVGKPQLHETWALLPKWKNQEPWWLRTHRLLVPRDDNIVASYCMQGDFAPSLQTAFLGRPGREIAVSAQV